MRWNKNMACHQMRRVVSSYLVVSYRRRHAQGRICLANLGRAQQHCTSSVVSKTLSGAYLVKSCVPLGNCLRTPCRDTTTRPSGFLAEQSIAIIVVIITTTPPNLSAASAMLALPSVVAMAAQINDLPVLWRRTGVLGGNLGAA